MQSLPSHRQFLTSLLNSIAEISSQGDAADVSSPVAAPPPPPTSSVSSPLQAIPPSQRPLLLTLHVLFPSLLLPALDLLDRGLVTRLHRKDSSRDTDANATSNNRSTVAGGIDAVFLVRSIATTMSRRSRHHKSSSQRYTVHLGAWNCSCASFTLDAFPSHPIATPGQEAASEPDAAWAFGGLSLDGMGTSAGDVPCCKHLLACLLVEKWPGVLGQYVQDRDVTRDEMAGIAAET